jgi:Fe-S cluster assembly ATP-binding protein
MLEIKDLRVNIADKNILDGLNLNIKEGEVHALMGVNGAGKSTLVKTLADHYDCEVIGGSVEYNGKNLLDLSVDERANEGLFLSFQQPVEVAGVMNNYFLKTALNAKRKYHGKSELDAMEFLKEVKTETSKFDIDISLLKRNLNEGFSGGEKKRNELIQLLLLKPDLIMLDEIDSGLDVDAIKVVANVINSLLDKKRSVLLITHYDRLLELIKPDFVHILSDGKIVKSGDYTLALELDKNGFTNIGVGDEKFSTNI